MISVNAAHKPAFRPGDWVEHKERDWRYPYVEVVECLPLDHYRVRYGDMLLVFARRELGRVVAKQEVA